MHMSFEKPSPKLMTLLLAILALHPLTTNADAAICYKGTVLDGKTATLVRTECSETGSDVIRFNHESDISVTALMKYCDTIKDQYKRRTDQRNELENLLNEINRLSARYTDTPSSGDSVKPSLPKDHGNVTSDPPPQEVSTRVEGGNHNTPSTLIPEFPESTITVIDDAGPSTSPTPTDPPKTPTTDGDGYEQRRTPSISTGDSQTSTTVNHGEEGSSRIYMQTDHPPVESTSFEIEVESYRSSQQAVTSSMISSDGGISGAKTSSSGSSDISTEVTSSTARATAMGVIISVCFLPEVGEYLQDGDSYVHSGCIRSDICVLGEVISDYSYQCDSNADCYTRSGVRGCYCPDGYHGDGQSCTRMRDCQDVFNAGFNAGGIYFIRPDGWSQGFHVYCDMTPGGGWTVLQRRIDGSVDFYLFWTNYKSGFGSLEGEHWLGNEKLYHLTNQKDYEIRVDLVNEFGTPYYAEYSVFRINDENDNYRLSALGTFSGTADDQGVQDGDSLSYHVGQQFSTRDRDNDVSNPWHCAEIHGGAWWYKRCRCSNLNGDYQAGPFSDTSIYWCSLPGSEFNLKQTVMKIRPAE